MTVSTRPVAPVRHALALASALISVAGKASADGSFFQLDLAPRASDAVFAITRGQMSFGANYATYEGGWSAGLHATRDFKLADVATVKLGPSLGFSAESRGIDLGGKVIVERYQPTRFGFVFLSAQYNTIQDDWFALAQVGDGEDLSLDFTAGGSETYSERAIALNYRPDDGPSRLRLGYRFEAGEVFVGLSVNTY